MINEKERIRLDLYKVKHSIEVSNEYQLGSKQLQFIIDKIKECIDIIEHNK